MTRFEVHHGDMLDVLPTLPADSLDACCTDPPYHLTGVSRGGSPRTNNPEMPFGRHRLGDRGFMGKQWDGGDLAMRPETWREVWRVLKPGAHLLCFAGTRTAHRIFCAVEDAGFEVRDQIMWVYGTGFPKSHNIGKALDKMAGAEREVMGPRIRVDGKPPGIISGGKHGRYGDFGDLPTDLTAPATPEAARWEGWGTALKPAVEPILVARKSLAEHTVAANVLRHGTGALNIDGCRVGYVSEADKRLETRGVHVGGAYEHPAGPAFKKAVNPVAAAHAAGRWPANLVWSVPEDEFELKEDVTTEQKRELYRWLGENA